MSTLGERIREARQARGLAQHDLARASGVSQGHAIATVRGVQNLGGLTVQEWVDELLRADRLGRKGREPEGREHEGDGPVGRTGSKVMPRRGR